MANTHLKRCSLSLTTRELHIKVILRYYYMTILTAQINFKKKMTVPISAEDMEKVDLSFIVGANIKWYSHFE